MLEIDAPLFFAVAIFFIVIGVVVKVSVLDRKLVRKLFLSLKANGYSLIDVKDTELFSKISRLFWEFDSKDHLNILDAVVFKQGISTRYIYDIHYYSSTEGTIGRRLCMVAEIFPIVVSTDIYIHRKITAFAQKWIMFLRKEKLFEITTGLQKDFSEHFSVFTPLEKIEITLPQSLQETLLRYYSQFPINKTSGELAMVRITPEGWSIMCQKITDKKHFDSLLKLADEISSSLQV